MKKLFTIFFLLISLFVYKNPITAHAVDNPLLLPNNKMGIHILFDHELENAAELVNSNGGKWGYVLIPIQSGDKDLVRWQKFMDQAKKNHVIPIIRLSTEGDYFNSKVWRKPDENDIIDFANFLDSLEWPVKNRYIIVFNEVNRGDEWGGAANPAEYANLLSFAVTVFKSKSPDFFIISAGLDNAAPNQEFEYINQYSYIRHLNNAVPGIFNQIDGMASHSYPNPGFSQPPSNTSPTGTGSFIFERQLIEYLSGKRLPVFITETGWSSDALPFSTINSYYNAALTQVWNDPGIVAIAPFVLQGSGGPFNKFSFLDENGNPLEPYNLWKNFPKNLGKPSSPAKILAAETTTKTTAIPKIDFKDEKKSDEQNLSPKSVGFIFKWLLGI